MSESRMPSSAWKKKKKKKINHLSTLIATTYLNPLAQHQYNWIVLPILLCGHGVPHHIYYCGLWSLVGISVCEIKSKCRDISDKWRPSSHKISELCHQKLKLNDLCETDRYMGNRPCSVETLPFFELGLLLLYIILLLTQRNLNWGKEYW